MHILLSLALPATLVAQATVDRPEPKPSETWKRLETWAGPEGHLLGFTQAKLATFMSARKADLAAGQEEPWVSWLKGLSAARNPSLKAWALARRLEAGDFTAFPDYRHALSEHLFGISKPHSGRAESVIAEPWNGLSSPLRIAPSSRFWKTLENLIRQTPEYEMDSSLYAVWCFGTAPQQRDTILGVASWVKPSVNVASRTSTPWNDPRFWIVVDWAMVWGNREDFKAIQQALPGGASRSEFQKILRQVESIPGFWESPLEDARRLGEGTTDLTSREASTKSVVHLPTPLRVAKMPKLPEYPEEARLRRLTDDVVVNITVDPEGKPVHARLLPGPWLSFFGPSALRFALDWRFEAPKLDGKPVAWQSNFRLPLHFRLRE